MVAPRSRASDAPSWPRMRFKASTSGPICAATSSSSACISCVAEACFSGQHTGQAKDGIQVRLLLERALGGGGAEGRDIALQQVTVKMSAGAKAAFDRQSNFQVPAQHFFLEQAAQTHLQLLGAGRHAHVQIEKPMVDALQRKIPGQKVADAAADPGKAGHRIDRGITGELH